MNLFALFKKKFIEFFFPSDLSCYVCGCDLDKKTKTHICDKCKSTLPFINNPCNRCGKQLMKDSYCHDCASLKAYYDKAVSVFEYDDVVANCVYRMKAKDERYLVEFMGYYMYCAFKNSHLNADAIVCVPLHKKKLRKREYNQAYELLKVCNRKLQYEDLSEFLVQKRETREQKKMGARARFTSSRDKYKLINGRKNFQGRKVLIIDDVFTTGATTNSIARLLKIAGAKSVYILTFASVSYKEDLRQLIDI
ncbi:MAG: ComF family protein [Christensenellales bacterium]